MLARSLNVSRTASVFNGSGFIGRNVVARLGKKGAQVVIGFRGAGYDEYRLRVCGDLGKIYFARYNLKDEDSLYNAMEHSDVVVNCIGKGNETKNFSFEDVHIEGPRRMARIAKKLGVKKFIHLSALNCNPNPTPVVLKQGSKFLKSKYNGELAVRDEFPEAIIFRPADVLGEKDDFLNHFTCYSRSLLRTCIPLYDYYDGVVKQPINIKDLIDGIEKAIESDEANGKTFQAVGPHRYNFYDLILHMRDLAGRGDRHKNFATNLRFDIPMRIYMRFISRFYKYPFLTWERVERDSTTDYVDPKLPTLQDLGVVLTPLEPQLELLAHYRPRLHRVGVSYQSHHRLEPPKRLDLVG